MVPAPVDEPSSSFTKTASSGSPPPTAGRPAARRGLELLEQVGDRHRQAYVEGLYALMLAEQADIAGAEKILRTIVDEFVARGDWRLRAIYLSTMAFFRAKRGDHPAARKLLQASDKLALKQSDPTAKGVLAVFAAGVDLLLSTDPEAVNAARAVLAGVDKPRPDPDDTGETKPPLTLISSEVRTALRILSANGTQIGKTARRASRPAIPRGSK